MVKKMKKKNRKWKYKKYYDLDSLPAISIRTDNHKRKEYYYALTQLVKMIWNQESKLINYMHLPFIVDKTPLPLIFEGKHRDISYIDTMNSLVLLWIDVIPYEQLPKWVKSLIWRRQS